LLNAPAGLFPHCRKLAGEVEYVTPEQASTSARWGGKEIGMAETTAGVIGVGVVGGEHLRALKGHASLRVVGIADQSAELCAARAGEYGLPSFSSHIELLEQARPDYVIVCTPHYNHVDIAIDAMRRGVHVLVEKPLTVRASDGEKGLDVMRETGMTMGVAFLSRLHPIHVRLYELLQSGFVGDIVRVTLVRTKWFRSMAYYRSNPWRATWEGEGGGILVNQAPHDLDLIALAAGLPSEVLAELNTLGHDIEVEDDVCALMKWPSGATGTLHVCTNEAPGRNFFEIAGTKGTLLLEDNCLKSTSLRIDSREFSETTSGKFDAPPVGTVTTFSEMSAADGYQLENENFAAAIRGDAPLMCSAEDGLKEVELANALLVSGVRQEWVRVPIDPAEYDQLLVELIKERSLARVKPPQRDSDR